VNFGEKPSSHPLLIQGPKTRLWIEIFGSPTLGIPKMAMGDQLCRNQIEIELPQWLEQAKRHSYFEAKCLDSLALE